jgi:hypothetical protein
MAELPPGYMDLLQSACGKADQERDALARLKKEHEYIEVLKLKNLIDLVTRLHRKLEIMIEQHEAGEPIFAHQQAVDDFVIFINRFGIDALNEACDPGLQVSKKRMARTAIDEKTLHMLGHHPVEGLMKSLGELVQATDQLSAG